MKTEKRIDEYIESAEPFARPVLAHLRKLVHECCPDVEEAWKWSFPNFMYNGQILCHMAAFKKHCSFGFWKTAFLPDPDNILDTNAKTMGHLGAIRSLKDLPKDSILKKYIRSAMKLNDEGVKLLRKKPTEQQKSMLKIPDYLAAALTRNAMASLVFKEFSYSNKKEYVDWLEEAKTEGTRTKRLEQAIEWIAAGKSRNWKYK